jgi:hypothetical protein
MHIGQQIQPEKEFEIIENEKKGLDWTGDQRRYGVRSVWEESG